MSNPRKLQKIMGELIGQDWFPDQQFPMPVASPSKSSTDLAQYLLTHQRPAGKIKPMGRSSFDAAGAKTEEPGVLSRFFDFLDQPGRVVRNTVDAFTSDDPNHSGLGEFGADLAHSGKALVGGVSNVAKAIAPNILIPDGAEKSWEDFGKKMNPYVKGTDILDNLGMPKLEKDSSLLSRGARAALGFGVEIGLDPLTYGTFGASGLVKGLFKGGEKAAGALEHAAATGGNADAFIKRGAEVASEGHFKPAVPNMDATRQSIHDVAHAPVANMALKPMSDAVPSPGTMGFGNSPMPRFELPGIPRGMGSQHPIGAVTPEAATIDNVGARILEDPVSAQAMQVAKKSDDGWRAAQKRWGRDPDVEEAKRAVEPALSKAEWSDKMRAFKLRKAGKVSDGKGNVSAVAVTDVIEQIQRGEIPSFGPQAEAAVGEIGDIARKTADDHIDNVMGKSRTDHNPANQANLYNRLYNQTADIIRNTPELAKKYGSKAGKVNVEAPRVQAARRQMAISMLRTAEDQMITLGAHPVYWDGTRLRLSDVLTEVGAAGSKELPTRIVDAFKGQRWDHIKDPQVKDAITRALARRPLHMSSMIEDLNKTSQEAIQHITDGYTHSDAVELLSKLPENMKEMGLGRNLTESEAKAVFNLAKDYIDTHDIHVARAVDEITKRLRQGVIDGRVSVADWRKVTKAIMDELGTTKKTLMTDVSGSKVLDGIMLRISTWWGRHTEMMRRKQDLFGFSEASQVMYARWLKNVFAGVSKEEGHMAMGIAQGRLPRDISTPAAAAAADKIQHYFDTIIGSSGFKHDAAWGGSVAERSRMTMEDVNAQLRALGSKFQFRNDRVNVDGVWTDYSDKGEGWLKSWELATISDPMSTMYDLGQAIDRTMKQYALVDDFGMRFGVEKGSHLFNPKIHTTRISSNRLPDNIYFEKGQAEQFQRILNDINNVRWSPNSPVLSFIAKAVTAWKTGVTIYTPSHHVRNMIGDSWLMWMAGHNDPTLFSKAGKVLWAYKHRYEGALNADTLDPLKQLLDKDAMELASARGKDVIIKTPKRQVTGDELYTAAFQHGLLRDANKIEDIFGSDLDAATPAMNLINALPMKEGNKIQANASKVFTGKLHNQVAKAAEYREHTVRMAHFIGAVRKGIKSSKGELNMTKIYQDAAAEVRKWHPDGTDLTQFEQKIRAYAIPFYSWTRKAVPLIVQAAVARPAKVLAYPRLQGALQYMGGIDQENPLLDPFPEDQLFPDWIRAAGVGPFGAAEDSGIGGWFAKIGTNRVGFHGEERGYTLANPGNPLNDMVNQQIGLKGSPTEITRGIVESLNPMMKIPLEAGFDSQAYNGAPISKDKGGQGLMNYLLGQVPVASAVNNITEVDYSGMKRQEKAQGTEKQAFDKQGLINYLTAAGIRGTGVQKSAEFEAKERARAASR